MSNLKVGYARVDATPPLGIDIAGYFVKRLAEGALDPLEVVAVAIKNGDSSALMITVDNCYIPTPIAKDWREVITAATGVEDNAIFIHATHTHQGPVLAKQHKNPIVTEYLSMLTKKVRDAAVMAIADLKGAHMGIGLGEAKNVAFVRRYRMKDGSAKTNPGVNNPDIVAPIGDTDERVGVVRLERECGDNIVIVNFANHPDVVGGNLLSADWPGLTRRMVERCIDDTKCIFFNGAQGDVNHVNVHPGAGDFNDMFNDFDGCSRGYGHARHIARVVTAAVMSTYDKVEWQENDSISYTARQVEIESNKADPKDLPLAHKYHELHISGRDSEIPFEAMMLTTVVAEAARMVRLENAPDAFPMRFSALSIGDVAFFGIPGEPFTGVGRGIKEAKGWKVVLPCCCLGGYEGYFPMKDSYDEGGYEARSSNYKKGSAEKIIEAGLEILDTLKA